MQYDDDFLTDAVEKCSQNQSEQEALNVWRLQWT